MGWWETLNQGVVALQSIGQQPSQQQAQLDDTGTAAVMSAPMETQSISAPMEPVIPANQSIVTDSRDPTGEYRTIDTDPSAPAKQSFVESYVAPESRVEIDRADYTKIADIGDSKTQALMKEGYSPEQATAMQRDEKISELMAKGYSRDQAAESKEARYYQVEYDKARENKIGLSSEYHHDALESGLPQNPNPFEYAGDIAKMDIYKSQGVSNLPGTGLLPTYHGSLLEMANLSTKAERTGQMGDYAYLGKPYSSTEGILGLARQQQIGEDAATSKFNPAPWSVDRDIMGKYTPELAKGAGFDLFYKEAKIGGGANSGNAIAERAVKAADVAGKGKAFDVELEDGTIVKRYESDWDIFPQAKSASTFGIAMDKDTVVKSPGITAGTINEYLLPEDRVNVGGKSDLKVELPGAKTATVSTGVIDAKKMVSAWEDREPTKARIEIPDISQNVGLPAVSITGASKKVEMVEAPASNWLNRYTKGATRGDESAGGLQLYKSPETPSGLLYRLPTPKGSAMDRGDFGITFAGASYRKPKKSKTHVDIKQAPKKVSNFYRVTNEQIIPQTVGKDFFKFKITSPGKVFKSDSAHEYVKATVNFNVDKIGVTKAKSIGKKLKLPEAKVSAKTKDVSGNINNMMDGITKSIKNVKTK
jgi:hypothetical protein